MLSALQRAARSYFLLLCWCVLLLATSLPLPGAPLWTKVSTTHFEMYTSQNEGEALPALQRFEEVRSFFQQNSKSKAALQDTVRIFAFSSEREYRPYRLNEGSFAYYVRSRAHDYIVMQDIQPDHYQAATHEYTHLVIEHAHMHLPLWLNEGLADFFSTLEPQGNQAMVGRPLPERLWTLNNQAWMAWNTLFVVDHSSSYYNQPDKMQMFYAQSWALTHMLQLDDRYCAAFPGFLEKVAGGMPTAGALQSSFGKTVKQVDHDLRVYLAKSTVHARLFDIALQRPDLHPQVNALTGLQVEVELATLLANTQSNTQEALNRLIALDTADPGNPTVETALGYLAWRENRLSDARQYLGRAIQHNSQDAQMIYQLAVLQKSVGAPCQEVVGLLNRVLALNPSSREALLLLGFTSTENRHYDAALSTLLQVKTIEPGEAYNYFAAMAFCYLHLKEPVAAKQNANRALTYAKTPAEKNQMDELLRYADRQGFLPMKIHAPLDGHT